MSGHLTVVAAYLDLPQPQKLILMKVCDSADQRSRIGFPGLVSLRLWSGTSKSRALELLNDLQERGLIMQIDGGNRGQRASFKAFPAPGDEVHSYAHKRGIPCPGSSLFAGSPGIPKDADLDALADARTVAKPRRRSGFAVHDGGAGSKQAAGKGSDPSDPSGGVVEGRTGPPMGPMDRTLPECNGSDPSDPSRASTTPGRAEKGSDADPQKPGKGSDGSDPFQDQKLKELTTNYFAAAGAATEKPDALPGLEGPEPTAVDLLEAVALDLARRWRDALPRKPTDPLAVAKTSGVLKAALVNGHPPEDVFQAAVSAGTKVSGGKLDYQFDLMDQARKPKRRSGNTRVADGNQDYWAAGGGFRSQGKEAS